MDIKPILPWINFIILAGVLFYYLKNPLREFLLGRHKKVREELQAVSQLLASTLKRHEEYKRRISQLKTEITQLKTEMCSIGTMEKEHLIRDAQEFTARIQADLKRAALQELQKAKAELQKKTLKLAFQLADQMVRDQVRTTDQERLSREYLTQLKGLHG